MTKFQRIAVLALGLLLVVRGVRATDSSEVDSSVNPVEEPFSQDAHVSLRVPLQSGENFSFGAVAEASDGEESASELNRKLTNPVSSIWSISNQFNNFELNNGHWNNNWLFQPVLPVSLTKDWNLVTRPVMPFYDIVPHETAPNEFNRAAGLGDLIFASLLSPSNSGNWVLGAGPTSIFPTATSRFTGQASGSSARVSWQVTSQSSTS